MRIGLLCAAVSLCALVGTPAAAQVQERTIRWGHLNNTDHPVSFGVKKFAEVLAAKSGGKLKIREFPASQLGNELQQQSAVRGGTQEILSASTTSLAGVVKDLGLFDFPFTVSTFEQAEALAQGAFGKAMLELLPEKELIGLGYWGLGFRNATNSSRPDREGRGFLRPQAARDPEPGLSRNLQGAEGEPGADGVRRIVHRAGKQDRRRPGEPLQRDPVQQVLRSAEIRLGHQPHLHAERHHRQQEVLGRPVRGRAEDAARQLCRDARVPARPDQARRGQGAG